MQFKETRKEQVVNLEAKIMELSHHLDELILQFNLYFSGELRVPPDMDRQTLAASIRNLQNAGSANATGAFLMQNLNSRFALYNNMWLKKMHDIEVGTPLPAKGQIPPPKRTEKPKPPESANTFDVQNPDSIKAIYAQYQALMTQNNQKAISDTALATALANRMREAHVDKASVSISFENGKLKIRLRK